MTLIPAHVAFNGCVIPFPAFRMKGTPSHLGLWMNSVVAANVGQTEPGGTVVSSRYPGLPSADTYWPRSVSLLSIGGIERRTLTYRRTISNQMVSYHDITHNHQLTFSSRISSAAKETGRSIVRILRTCSRSKLSKDVNVKSKENRLKIVRFCRTSRMIPNSSK